PSTWSPTRSSTPPRRSWSTTTGTLRTGLGLQKSLDRAPLVHGPVALGDLGQRKNEVEDLARVDLPVPDQLDQLGQEAAYRSGAAAQTDLRAEQLLRAARDTVGDADIPDRPSGSGRRDRLLERLVGAHALQHRVGADAVGEVQDLRDPLVATLLDDVGGAVLARQLLPRLVPAEHDDPLRAQLPRPKDAEQPHPPGAPHGPPP